jgi:hypothetical protein
MAHHAKIETECLILVGALKLKRNLNSNNHHYASPGSHKWNVHLYWAHAKIQASEDHAATPWLHGMSVLNLSVQPKIEWLR